MRPASATPPRWRVGSTPLANPSSDRWRTTILPTIRNFACRPGLGTVTTQQVLDVALAWAVLNRHFEIASFLLERGADINTNWSTHEPASILHEAAIQGNEEAVRFLIDHGADLTMTDYRYQSTAEGWARYAAHDEPLAELLAAARRSGERS